MNPNDHRSCGFGYVLVVFATLTGFFWLLYIFEFDLTNPFHCISSFKFWASYSTDAYPGSSPNILDGTVVVVVGTILPYTSVAKRSQACWVDRRSGTPIPIQTISSPSS